MITLRRLVAFVARLRSLPRRGWVLLVVAINFFLDFFTVRRSQKLIVGLTAAFFLVVFLTPGADAQGVIEETLDKIGAGIFVVLNSVLLIILQTVAQLASLVVSLLVAISQFNKFTTVRVVDVGWTIVKDVSNMLFIIALLVIAAGTVLRLENYRYNRLLSNLIIMAFLTNFSKFIAAFFIQGAQVLMLTFVNAYKEALFGNFVSAFGLEKVLRFSPDATTLEGAAVFSNLLAGLILVVIALIITAAICVVLFVRIVALWILVILSPLAFATQILPNTKSFASKWWSEFGKYVIQGPILAFFLWLALAIVTVGNSAASIDPSLGTIANDATNVRGGANFFQVEIFTIDSLMTFVISAAFLVFGLNYATSSSGVAGKWAGKVASTGFAGARAVGGTISGINAVRDRVVLPAQGWIKNRQAARQATIQERTQRLEAAGDRIRAAVPNVGVENIPGLRRVPGLNKLGTRAGGEKSAAAVAAYERQRAQRQIQERGMQDMKNDALQDRFQNSVDHRERLAAAQVLAQRNGINLNDKAQQTAFDAVLNRAQTPYGVREDLKKQVYASHIGTMNPQQIKKAYQAAQASGNLTAANAYGAALVSKDLLDVKSTDDQQVVRQLLANLQQNTQELKNFRANLMKENPEMAKKVLFNDLATGEDRTNYLTSIQQGEMSSSTVTKDTLKKFAAAGEAGAIGDYLIKISPDTETLRRHKQNMDPEVAEEAFRHITVADDTTMDERQRIARATGQWSKAFTRSDGSWITEKQLDEDGNEVQVSSAKLFMDKLGGEEVSKSIANDSLKDENVLKALRESENMKFPHWEAIRNRSKETRTALTEGLTAYADKLAAASPDGKIDLDPNNKENNFVVTNLALASKGEDLRHDLTSETGRRAFENLVRGSKAADLAKLDKSDAYQNPETRKLVTQTYGMTADPAKIADMLQFENTDFAKESLDDAQEELLKRIADGDMKAFSRLTQMARHPVLSEFVKTPEKPNKGGSDTAAVVPIAPGTPPGDKKDDREKKGDKKEGEEKKGGKEGPPDSDEPPPEPTPTPKGPTPGTPPTGNSRAARDARRAVEAWPGSKIVIPGDSDFPSREERNLDPRIAALTPEQRALRQTVVDARRKAEKRMLTEDEKYDKDAVIKGVLDDVEQADFKNLEKRFGSKITPLTDDERKRYRDYAVKIGLVDPGEEGPETGSTPASKRPTPPKPNSGGTGKPKPPSTPPTPPSPPPPPSDEGGNSGPETGGAPAPRTSTRSNTGSSVDRTQPVIEGKRIADYQSPESPFVKLYEATTPEAVKAIVTPEMKQALLQDLLSEVDSSIRQSREFVEKNPGTKLNKRNLAMALGLSKSQGSAAGVLQKIAVASGGPVLDLKNLSKMATAEYLKKYLDYDLKQDTSRAEALRKYTNLLDEE